MSEYVSSARQATPGPAVSVIVPVHDGGRSLGACLEAVCGSTFRDFEVVVVDDASHDGSAAVARAFPCRVVELAENAGPAAARNAGARVALGGILFFLDADVVVRPDTVGEVARALGDRPELSALFGSYGRATVPTDFCSRYKNLLHHHTHQTAREDAATFCAGFGAIRREVFFALGGFDPGWRYLEDIELGHRLHRAGHRVLLHKRLQMTHCKRYTLRGLVRSDLFGRAVPWTRLMLENRVVRNDLNTRWHNVLSVPLAGTLLGLPYALATGWARPVMLAATCAFVGLNGAFLTLARREYGVAFAARACLMTWLFYLYSALGVALGVAAHLRARLRAGVRPAGRPAR